MTELTIRLIEYAVLALVFGGMAIDLVVGFRDDYGAPWRRKPGTNGRWRTDLFVVVLVATLGAICAVAFTSALIDGWHGARTTTTVLLGVLVLTVVGLWLSGKVERHKTEVRGEGAAARTERAADRAEVASEDTRRSARKTEVAAETVIERMVEGEETARQDAAANETRGVLREERADAREERASAMEARADARENRVAERDLLEGERAASDDARRSAHRTEEAAARVAERTDGEA